MAKAQPVREEWVDVDKTITIGDDEATYRAVISKDNGHFRVTVYAPFYDNFGTQYWLEGELEAEEMMLILAKFWLKEMGIPYEE